MAWTDWLILVVALLVGIAAGWAIRRRRNAAPTATTVDGARATVPAAGGHEPAPATTETGRPEATVVPAPATVADRAVAGTPHGHTDDDGPTPVTAASTEPVDPVDVAPVLDRVTPTTGVVADADVKVGAPRPAPDTGTSDDGDPIRREAEVPATEAGTPIAEAAGSEQTRGPVGAEPEPAATPERTVSEPAVTEPAGTEPAGTEPAAAEPAATEPAATEPAATEPVAVPAPRRPVVIPPGRSTSDAGVGDDFRRIQGIGPKMAAALHAAGIRTYRQLAELDESSLRGTIRAAGLRAAPGLATWPQQAQVLADNQPAATVLPADGKA
ncbi:helix-hairpin-helix domain-containing protein [Micromonospora sp. WMMA1363]|uniref:helix-hairpin-helix domain-containing protein n=1 Tax=Micromonospora sp. WMMA1363 TaxID=3053985 RepID=UPI00259C8B1C|nr:helix-hairpin-helix domain-containing protein [Micromonospora sp. WMMA1363]MDM4718988.1 helix-hairpin-helix domain-containing protein [Micromonospora sp. WMMA1363]